MTTLTLVEPLRRARRSVVAETLRTRLAERRAQRDFALSGDARAHLDLAAVARRAER